jgi:hypothetical protein
MVVAIMVANIEPLKKLEFDMNPGFTIIGLLGPAGSGKDLVADWFCNEKDFVKVAFADPIKRFAAQCFGIDKERLWGPSEKRNELLEISDDWWYEAIGHLGRASEEILNSVLSDGNRVHGYLELHNWFTWLRKTYPKSISARIILQTLGTEWGRVSVYDLLWADYGHKVINQLRTPGFLYSQEDGLIGPKMSAMKTPVPGVIIPDHRFENEVQTTKKNDGYVLRLRRLALEEKNETIGISGHRSENELKSLPDELFNLTLMFPEGVDRVQEMLNYAFEEQLWARPNPTRFRDLDIVRS